MSALVPSIWMRRLMRMASNEIRLSAIQSPEDSEESSESETQEEKTLPKVVPFHSTYGYDCCCIRRGF